MKDIEAEMWEQVHFSRSTTSCLRRSASRQRTQYDHGNAAGDRLLLRHRELFPRHCRPCPGTPPTTLLDYFPDDFILFVDESHVTLPQVRAMYDGDHARKKSLVDYGFRLPSAYDNRPLTFDEFTDRIHQAIYVSATPGEYERSPRRTDRRAGHPARRACSTRRSSCAPSRGRSTI